jgi:hypothetical protein
VLTRVSARATETTANTNANNDQAKDFINAVFFIRLYLGWFFYFLFFLYCNLFRHIPQLRPGLPQICPAEKRTLQYIMAWH